MNDSRSEPREVAPGPEPFRAQASPLVALLLVSGDGDWVSAVNHATVQLGGGSVLRCNARDALTHLAARGTQFSHLLIDRDHADGLLGALADLAGEVAEPDTDLLLLGTADALRPHLRVIANATSGGVVEALMKAPIARDETAVAMADLETAIRCAAVQTRYQPIIRIADARPVALEALARLHIPARGTVLPDQFVPQIEDAGLAAELTSLVSKRAFADLSVGPLSARRPVVTLNFPLDVLTLPSALERLDEERAEAGIPAQQIIIELTESRPAEDIPMLGRALERLRANGYGVSIDDVGPAVPDLNPLLELPFSGLKLDKDIVRSAGASASVSAFIATVVASCKTRGWTVVAEGVEIAETWNLMRDMGVDCVQGFYAARPLPAAAVPIWWDAWERQHMAASA